MDTGFSDAIFLSGLYLGEKKEYTTQCVWKNFSYLVKIVVCVNGVTVSFGL